MPMLKEEKKSIEQRELERRRRIMRGSPSASTGEPEEWWSMEKVESFYRECAMSRDDQPSPEISAAFKVRASFHEGLIRTQLFVCPFSINYEFG